MVFLTHSAFLQGGMIGRRDFFQQCTPPRIDIQRCFPNTVDQGFEIFLPGPCDNGPVTGNRKNNRNSDHRMCVHIGIFDRPGVMLLAQPFCARHDLLVVLAFQQFAFVYFVARPCRDGIWRGKSPRTAP